MKVCVLSITRVGEDYFSIAGINLQGEWVRPISDGPDAPYWDDTHLRFDTGFGFLRNGDIIEFTEKKPFKQNQKEDYVVVSGDIVLKQRLSNKDLLWFLESAAEPLEAFEDTIHNRGRSLCIVKVDHIKHYAAEIPGELPVLKAAITNRDFHLLNPENNASNFTLTDLKWCQLIKDNKLDNRQQYATIYVVFGLEPKSADTPDILEPHVIGIHTDPEIDLPNMYPY